MHSTQKLGTAKQPPRLASEEETAEYIADLLTELERLAQTQRLGKLQSLLRACREEASRIATG